MNRIVLFILLQCAYTGFAQNKLFSIEDAVLKQRTTLGPERLAQLDWITGTHKFVYVAKKDGKEVIVQVKAQGLTRDTVLEFADFFTALLGINPEEKKLDRFPQLTWVSEDTFRYFYKSAYYLFSIKDKTNKLLVKAMKESEDFDFEPKTNKLAYTVNNNVFVSDINSKFESSANAAGETDVDKKDMITSDGTYGLVNGKTVHRSEFGINKGLFWSPEGNKIAFYKMMEGAVTDYGLMQLNNVPTTVKNIKYPMAGSTSHIVKVYIKDFKKNRVLEVKTGEPLVQYLTNIAWSPSEEYLYIAVLNRGQNIMNLNMYDASTGAFIKTLFTEKSDKYVEPQNPILFVKGNKSQFIWQSERDGFNQLYLYNSKGEVIRQLTKGRFDVKEVLGFDEKGTNLFYMAVSEDGLNKYCYSVDLKSGKSFQITKNPGQHSVSISDDGFYLLDTYSSLTVPRRISLMDTKGKEYGLILNSVNPISDYAKSEIKLFSIPSTDKTVSLNCRLILPPSFDSTKKYPVITYVYGGPHLQLVNNSWLGNADMWLLYMAQNNFIVFALDNRGSANRGIDFENATFRHLGKIEMEDQLAGANYLKSLSFVDKNRMGIFGWSFGGFMSTSLMTKSPGAYKVGVAGGPVIDWKMYEIMYTERYMDMPSENPEGYKEADLTNYVKNLQGRLMLIHGTSDDVVVWQHTLNYLKKCVSEGVLVDYFVYPGHGHNVVGPDRVHLMKKVTQYFNDFL